MGSGGRGFGGVGAGSELARPRTATKRTAARPAATRHPAPDPYADPGADDFTVRPGRITIPAGYTRNAGGVWITDDNDQEPDETRLRGGGTSERWALTSENGIVFVIGASIGRNVELSRIRGMGGTSGSPWVLMRGGW